LQINSEINSQIMMKMENHDYRRKWTIGSHVWGRLETTVSILEYRHRSITIKTRQEPPFATMCVTTPSFTKISRDDQLADRDEDRKSR